MWIARDKSGNLMFWDCSEKPERVCDRTWACKNYRGVGYLDFRLFPDQTWEDEPKEVDIVSKTPWISVSDSLPEKDDEIYVTFPPIEGHSRVYAFWKGYLLLDDIERGENDVDFWMHVPKL